MPRPPKRKASNAAEPLLYLFPCTIGIGFWVGKGGGTALNGAGFAIGKPQLVQDMLWLLIDLEHSGHLIKNFILEVGHPQLVQERLWSLILCVHSGQSIMAIYFPFFAIF